MQNKTLFDTLIVVKRSGQRTSFQGEKIALAIQKAFRSLDIPYQDVEVNRVYSKVLKKIEKEYQNRKTINIENIQDIIEEVLQQEKFMDVYEAFSTYREQRNASRKAFVGKQQHKFLKAIEALGLHYPNEQEENTPVALTQKFGSTISYEFAKAYLLDNKTVKNHDSGILSLHSIESIPMGSIESIAIDLRELETLDTPFSEQLREQVDIQSYLSSVKEMIVSLHKEVYGPIMFVNFDQALEGIVFRQYQEILKSNLALYFYASELDSLLSLEKLEKEIEKSTDFTLSNESLTSFFHGNQFLYYTYQKIEKKSLQQTKSRLEKTLAHFFSSFQEVELAFNFGMAISKAGTLVLETILDTMSAKENISYFFQVSKKINMSKNSLNYSFLQRFSTLASSYSNCYYVFIDCKFNALKEDVVSYFPRGARVIEDNTTLEKKLVGGKGNLATVSINIVRIALKHPGDIRGFYQELEEVIKYASEALLNRFELECSKRSSQFPVLYGDGVWHDGEKMKDTDRLRKILKHGTLTIHFCGLKECLVALSPKASEEESFKQGFEIVQFMKKKINQLSDVNNLNFSLSAIPSEEIEKEFKQQDTAIYGKIKGITDQEKYSSGYFLKTDPMKFGPFQKLTNGGHVDVFLIKKNEEIEHVIETLAQQNFGCVQIKRSR